MNLFTERVIIIIQEIPTGKVMSYGQVAAAAGSLRAARQVVRILHSMSKKYELPWHRIINVQGKISAPATDHSKGNIQRSLLEAEGVKFGLNEEIDFNTYRWFPLEVDEW